MSVKAAEVVYIRRLLELLGLRVPGVRSGGRSNHASSRCAFVGVPTYCAGQSQPRFLDALQLVPCGTTIDRCSCMASTTGASFS